jgi:short-subunit dehydrogenase
MTDLSHAVVMITGAGGGFGRQMARQFQEAGGRLILTDVDEDRLTALQADIGAESENILASIPADLSDENGCEALYSEVVNIGTIPDVIVNNAGVGLGGRFDHVPQERWERLMQINLLAPMRLCHRFLPHLIERQSGHIVNISSIAGWIGSKGLTSYCSAKYGLRGFSEALAGDVEEFGVQVSTVYPFFSRTPILDSDQFGYEKRREVPLDMATDPADVVAAIIRGIRNNRQHIFPDRTARQIHYITRLIPWVVPFLNRRMQEKISSPVCFTTTQAVPGTIPGTVTLSPPGDKVTVPGIPGTRNIRARSPIDADCRRTS